MVKCARFELHGYHGLFTLSVTVLHRSIHASMRVFCDKLAYSTCRHFLAQRAFQSSYYRDPITVKSLDDESTQSVARYYPHLEAPNLRQLSHEFSILTEYKPSLRSEVFESEVKIYSEYSEYQIKACFSENVSNTWNTTPH